MNASEYLQKLIDENPSQPSFDDLRHLAQNIVTVCGVSMEESYSLVFARKAEVFSAGLVAG